MLALTHVPSPRLHACQLTHIARQAIDYPLACQQHAAYCDVLRECGALVRMLDIHSDLPDGAFIEDTAIVLDEVAILCSMGTASRRAEPSGIEPELCKYREIQRIELPAIIEGGDVLHVGHKKLLVGVSSRTNLAGISALEAIVHGVGYSVLPVPVHDCLHLKTACTALPDDALLVNPAWLDLPALNGFELLRVPAEEPFAANVALVCGQICLAAAHVQTADLIRKRGFDVQPIELSELAKAEAGVTCLSLLIA